MSNETRSDEDRQHFIKEYMRPIFRKILLGFAFFGITTAVLGYYMYATSENNRTALCALRADSENRVATTKDFLKENPNGIPGITPEQLQRSLDNSTLTVDALSDINCNKGE